MDNVFKEALDRLSSVFRHILPGLFAIFAAKISHPEWFCKFHVTESNHLLLAAAVAFTFGCIYFVVHRHTVHQLLDWLVWLINGRLGSTYRDCVLEMTHWHFVEAPDKLRDYVHHKNSQVILCRVMGELIILAACFANPCSFVGHHSGCISFIGVLIWISALNAHRLAFRLQLDLIYKSGQMMSSSQINAVNECASGCLIIFLISGAVAALWVLVLLICMCNACHCT